jgi:hypothetical protein
MPRIRLRISEADGRLPMICMVCGATATQLRRKQFTENAFGGWGVLESANLRTPLCDEHQSHWSRRTRILSIAFVSIWIIGGLAAVTAFNFHADDEPVAAIGVGTFGCLMPFWLALLAYFKATAIYASEITGTHIVLENVSDAFVDAIEESDRDGGRGWHDPSTDGGSIGNVRSDDAIKAGFPDKSRVSSADAIEEA